jgi:hypothetical protein
VWPWNDPLWPYDHDDTYDGTTVALPSPCIRPPTPDAPAPAPFQYRGQTVAPAFDAVMQQWGFWFLGSWVPLFGPGCR